jgi:hypothetical protein
MTTYKEFITFLEELDWTYDRDPNAIEFWAQIVPNTFFTITVKGLIIRGPKLDLYWIHAMRHWAHDKYHRLLIEKDVDVFATNDKSSLGATFLANILRERGIYHG